MRGEPVLEVSAGEVGHRIPEDAVGIAGVEQREDAGVRQPRGGLDLPQETIGADDIGAVRGEGP